MNTNGRLYSIAGSDARIREILDANDQGYEEVDSVPALWRLTNSNGFYVNHCVAVFIDIRGSSQLANNHTRPVLGKLYRAYLSECVAILNQDPNCKQVFIHGDCVSGMIDGNKPEFVDGALFRAFQLNSLVNMLNWRLGQRGYAKIQCGIGMDYGRALILQGGCSGTGINEVIWMGEVVNNAADLCNQGNKRGLQPIQVSSAAYERLGREDYKRLLIARTGALKGHRVAYEANAESTEMQQWLVNEQQKCAKQSSGLNALGMLGKMNSAGGFGRIAAAQATPQPKIPQSNLVGLRATQDPLVDTPISDQQIEALGNLRGLWMTAAQDPPTKTLFTDYNAALVSALRQQTRSQPGQETRSMSGLANPLKPSRKK